MTEKEYFVPFECYGEDNFVEKRSKFTGRLWHVETPEEAVAKIKEMREKYWDAAHNCWAYILREGNIMRYSDDGEPQGTAGLPILTAIDNNGIVDCCIVVTRYFGGTLLGAGGLVRAYTKSAVSAIEEAGKAEIVPVVTFTTEFPYDRQGRIKTLLSKVEATDIKEDYGQNIVLTATMAKDDFSGFESSVKQYFYDQHFTIVCEKNGRR